MPLDAAVADISLSEQYAAATLAGSAAFRALVKANTVADALKRIHFKALPPPAHGEARHTADELKGYRPFAIVSTQGENGFSLTRRASGCFVEHGQIGIHLEDNVPENLLNDNGQVFRRFENTLGTILREMAALAYTPGYLTIDDFQVQAIGREAEDCVPEHGDNICAFLNLPWGGDA